MIGDDETLVKLLTLFNDNWKDERYRDIIPVKVSYSDIQREYFRTPPGERMNVIKKIVS